MGIPRAWQSFTVAVRSRAARTRGSASPENESLSRSGAVWVRLDDIPIRLRCLSARFGPWVRRARGPSVVDGRGLSVRGRSRRCGGLGVVTVSHTMGPAEHGTIEEEGRNTETVISVEESRIFKR